MCKYILLVLLICNLLTSCKESAFELKEGDLLFQKWTASNFAQAINKVTSGYGDNDFAHIGMIINENDTLKVFEATQKKGVSLIDIDQFLAASTDSNGNPLVAVGRIKKEHLAKIPQINTWVLDQLDKHYDTLFIYGNEKYYCSELIHDAFNTNTGEKIFDLAPMTFKDPDTNEFFPIWVEYFESNNFKIPEGQPGINPGMMSRSSSIEIVHEYFSRH